MLSAAAGTPSINVRVVALGLVLWGAAVGMTLTEAEQHAICNDCRRAMQRLEST
jgi:hypothetical protein